MLSKTTFTDGAHAVDTREIAMLYKWTIVFLLILAGSGCSGGKTVCATTADCGAGDSSTGDSSIDGDNQNGNPNTGDTDLSAVSGLELTHRSGQTFLTWDEPSSTAGYHVYRSDSPITGENLDSATKLTERWGPLDSNTSLNRNAVTDVPPYFVIEDLGAPLSASTGLFVHTSERAGTAYYAVTVVDNGVEDTSVTEDRNTAAVEEAVATPQPVLTLSVNGGKGRLYTQYMDYQQWNPTLNGYAFNYYVALPFDYNPVQSYPLQVELHAYGYFPTLLDEVRFEWQVIQLMPIDPGDNQGTAHTWWYGHARDHNYKRNGDIPTSGAIENFTEQRVMKAIQEVIDNPDFNINADLTHAQGNSMGASGVVSLGLRYPSVFVGIYASEPMMNYRTGEQFSYNFQRLLGRFDSDLPVVNRGLYSESIQRYGEGGSQPTTAWNWMDHHTQVRRRRADDFAYLMIDFGKADTIIDWQTQGRPTFAALTDARIAYSATAREGVAHEWRAFDAVNQNLFGYENPGWRYSYSVSYPGLHNASDSGRIDPPSSGDDLYQTSLEWSAPHYAFGQPIVDQPNRYEVTLRSLTSPQTVDVTPRNTQLFKPAPDTVCSWSAQHAGENQLADSGTVAVDVSGLVTVQQVPVATGNGSRLVIDCG